MSSPRTAAWRQGRAAPALVAVAAMMMAVAGVPGVAVAASTVPLPGAAVLSTVTTGPARSLGEPVAAQDAAVSAVAATSWGPAGALVRAWTRPAKAGSWTAAGQVLPAGFGSSYDAAATAAPGGPLLIVAGTAPAGVKCIAGGSVAIADVSGRGALGTARLVSDQRGTGSFDDRPAVAAGAGGTVWVAWSQGADSEACQDVAAGDQLEVAVSHDYGRTFGAPLAMPTAGGDSAFGARLTPLGNGRVAVSWMERMTSKAGEAVLVSVLGPDRTLTPPQQVLAGEPMPLALPDASFYDFPAGDVTVLPGGDMMVAAPLWQSGHGVIAVAVGAPGGTWRTATIAPPAGSDLLLPTVAALGPASVLLVCAAHQRTGDRLGYDWADVQVTSQGAPVPPGALVPLTPAPPGPGFFEIGEELALARGPGGLLAAVVVAGRTGATLQTVAWSVPALAPSPSPSPSTTTPAAAGTAGAAPGHKAGASAWLAAGVGAALLVLLLLLLTVVRRARRPRAYPAGGARGRFEASQARDAAARGRHRRPWPPQ